MRGEFVFTLLNASGLIPGKRMLHRTVGMRPNRGRSNPCITAARKGLGGRMSKVYASDSEAALHEAAIDALAIEFGRPVSEVRSQYERELQRLETGARIRDFLSVCATRHTREVLRMAGGN